MEQISMTRHMLIGLLVGIIVGLLLGFLRHDPVFWISMGILLGAGAGFGIATFRKTRRNE